MSVSLKVCTRTNWCLYSKSIKKGCLSVSTYQVCVMFGLFGLQCGWQYPLFARLLLFCLLILDDLLYSVPYTSLLMAGHVPAQHERAHITHPVVVVHLIDTSVAVWSWVAPSATLLEVPITELYDPYASIMFFRVQVGSDLDRCSDRILDSLTFLEYFTSTTRPLIPWFIR